MHSRNLAMAGKPVIVSITVYVLMRVNSKEACDDFRELLIQAFQSKSSSKVPAMEGVDNVSEGKAQQLGTDPNPNMSENAALEPEGVSSILRQPEVA